MDEIVEAVDVELEPFSYVRKRRADLFREFIEDLREFIEEDFEILAETVKNKPHLRKSWRFNKYNRPINFIIYPIHSPLHDDGGPPDFSLHPLASLTLALKDKRYITIIASLACTKDYFKEEYSKSLKNLLADLDSKSFRLFMDKPDIFMSKPYVFSIEVTDTGIIEVELGMFALDYYKMNLNFMDSNTNV